MEFEIDETGLDLDRPTTDGEAKLLALLAKTASHGAIVEIGSYKGKSTVYLAKGAEFSNEGLKVYAIDPHLLGTERIFKENIKKLKLDDIVVPLIMKSEEAVKQWREPISLLFIDGAHDYENAKKDFALWEPWVIAGGTIAFHDKFAEGPAKVIRNHIIKSSLFGKIGSVERILFATKGSDSTFSDKLTKLKWFLLYYTVLVISYVAVVAEILTRPKQLHWLRRALAKVGRQVQ